MLNFENRLRDDNEINEMGIEFKMSEMLDKNFLDLTNQEAINYNDLASYMDLVMQEFRKALDYKLKQKAKRNNFSDDEDDEEEKDDEAPKSRQFIGRLSRRDLFKRLHTFLLRCLRKIRSYNFNMALVDQIARFYEFLYQSEKVMDRDIINLRYYFAESYKKMKVKAENDPKLDIETFKDAFSRFKEMYRVVELRGNEIEALQRKERFLKNEEKKRFSKIVRNLERGTTDMVEMK
jgi:hypothetical protein